MKNFLDQFPLAGIARLDLERFIFTQADKMVGGYGGGTWATKTVGKVIILLIPVDDKKAPVTLTNYAFGGVVTTDYLTACAAFSSIVVNWYANLRAEQGRISDRTLEAISDYAYALRGEVYADAPVVPFNTSDYFSFTD